MRADLPLLNGPSSSTLVLWVSPIDERNCVVDPVFVQAAERIGVSFFLHRARDLHDASRVLELVEKAVHQASRAKKSRPVEDPAGYLFRTFAHLVDAELERSRRFLSLSDDLMPAIGQPNPEKQQSEIERQILWREILESLDETSAMIIQWLRQGIAVQDIARELGISPNTLAQRLSRLRRNIRKRLVPESRSRRLPG